MIKVFFISLLLLSFFSCSKETKEIVEEKKIVGHVSQVVSAEDGGTVQTGDGEGEIEIPAGALDKDTEISITVYKKTGFPRQNDLITKVFEFGPAGLQFSKKVYVRLKPDTDLTTVPQGKRVVAGLLKDSKWIYEGSGDPIMSGAPIMSGDPIMMEMGHFSTVAFILVDIEESHHDRDDDIPDNDHSEPVNASLTETASLSLPGRPQKIVEKDGKIFMAFDPSTGSEMDFFAVIDTAKMEIDTILSETTDLININDIAVSDEHIYYTAYGQDSIFRRDIVYLDFERFAELYSIHRFTIDPDSGKIFAASTEGAPLVAFDICETPLCEKTNVDFSSVEEEIYQTLDVIYDGTGNIILLALDSATGANGVVIVDPELLEAKSFIKTGEENWFSWWRMNLTTSNEVLVPMFNLLDGNDIKFAVIKGSNEPQFRAVSNIFNNFALSSDGNILLGFIQIRGADDDFNYVTVFELNNGNYERVEDILIDYDIIDVPGHTTEMAFFDGDNLYLAVEQTGEYHLKKYFLEIK